MLRAVGFDLWETLITNTPEVSEAQKVWRLEELARIFRARGISIRSEALDRAHRDTWHHCFELYWADDRDIPTRQQVIHMLEFLGVESPDSEFLDELEEIYAAAPLHSEPPLVVEHAESVLRWVKDQGLGVGLISNTGRTPGRILRQILDRLGLGAWIDAMVFSNEHGECKPRESIFTTLRSALGVDGSEMVFVGDNLYVDILGAQRCGMKAVHFDPETKGLAVAPVVNHGHEIVPDATIRTLAELPRVIETFRS